MKPLRDMPEMYIETKYKILLDDLFENSDIYIKELNSKLVLNLNNSDTIDDLVKLDNYFLNLDVNLLNYNFDPIRKQLFAYFSRTIANEKKFEDYKFEIDEIGNLNFFFYDKKGDKKYEIYQEFRSMLFKKDEYFSFRSRAEFIFSEFRLKLDNTD